MRFMSRWDTRSTATSLLAVLLVILLGSFTALAQGGSLGSVAGVVKDPSGAAIVGATVTLKNNGTGDTKTATTSNEGSFNFALINNGSYTVSVDKEGFKTANYTDVSVLPGQQYSLVATMQVGARAESVEVVAGQDIINTTTSEISGSVTQSQMLNLPLLGRNPIELMRNQAGVPGILAANRENTGINGGRPGWTQITQDGINIQDNFIRNNGTDFVPTRPTSDTIGEFSVVTAVAGADSVGGSSQVRLVTPSGTNSFHGAVYEYNRNSALSAYNFFSKRVSPLPPKPFLNQNQFGGKLGGPIIKNKLFFWGSYEGFRERQTQLTSLIVPSNTDYVTGVYRYVPASGTVNAVNVLNMINANIAAKRAAGTSTLPNLVINPLIQSRYLSAYSTNGNSVACGDSTATSIRNTTCDQFNQSHPTNRNQESFRFDYNMTSKHTLQFNYQRFYDYDARPDIDNVNAKVLSSIATKQNLFSGAWRWTISNRFLNEFRAGDLTSAVPFLRGFPTPDFFLASSNLNAAGTLTGLGLTAPATQFTNQGRNVTTRQYMDNASYTWGSHNLQFGGGYQGVQPHSYNFANLLPTVTFGFAASSPFNAYNLTPTGNLAANFPAGQTPTQTQVNAMNAYAAFLAGAVSTQAQTFQAKDATSGFVAGYPNARAFSYSIWSSYLKDEWRLKPNITLTLGLKYEYWTPVSVGGNLGLVPVVTSDVKSALLDPNGTVAPASTLWKPDRNQFAPSVGVAWSWNPKTVIRLGYAMNFVNEDSVTAASNALVGNFGLVGGVTQPNLGYILSAAPVIATPPFSPNRTYSQQLTDAGVTAAAFAIDPKLRTPSEHSLSIGVQRELGWNSALEVRYVGTFSRDLWRGVDYNQQIAAANPNFLADFIRARSNGFLALAATGTFNPVYNAAITGSQPLTWFPTIDSGGLLSNSSVQSDIRSGQIGTLADLYVTNRSLFPIATGLILPNKNIYAADAIINGGRLNYNSLQVEFRRRNVHGFSFQANYTFSKDLSDTYGDSQTRFEPLVDNARPNLAYERSPFDINHVFNANFVYELPFGQGKRFLGGSRGVLDKIVGGWSTSTIFRWQSGSPFSIYSGYQTFQRRTGTNNVSAYSPLTVSQIKNLIHISTVNGITYWIDPKVIASNGTAVGTDAQTYAPQFTGQVFFNPQPNELGSYSALQFSGPATISWDASAKKAVKFWEAHPIVTTFSADFFNATNSQFYFVGDNNINSSTFGRTSARALANRIIQMSLRIDF